ncbi:nucleotidyltransferase, partial [Corallococcus sicarius]
ARVGQGARLERCAVFEETEVAPGEALAEVLAWGPHRVPAPLTGR